MTLCCVDTQVIHSYLRHLCGTALLGLNMAKPLSKLGSVEFQHGSSVITCKKWEHYFLHRDVGSHWSFGVLQTWQIALPMHIYGCLILNSLQGLCKVIYVSTTFLHLRKKQTTRSQFQVSLFYKIGMLCWYMFFQVWAVSGRSIRWNCFFTLICTYSLLLSCYGKCGFM